MMDYKCGAIGGMVGRKNPSILWKFAPVPLFPPQIPHDPYQVSNPGRWGEKPETDAWATAQQKTEAFLSTQLAMSLFFLFNQPEIGRRLNRLWPEDLIRQAPENYRRMVPASDIHIHPIY
jgi:hypothetical protein